MRGRPFDRYPASYLTPRVRLVLALGRHFRRGRVLRAEPFLAWPAPLAVALDLLDRGDR